MEITGLHSEAWGRLNALRSKLPSALLIAGRRGIGKFELARFFARSLLCEQRGENFEPCGRCQPCAWFLKGNHPDFRLLRPASEEETPDNETSPESSAVPPKSAEKKSRQITIDQVRALHEFLHVGTHRHGLRVILVYPAESMNRNTANALLRSIEEPAPGTLFLFVSSEFSRLLPTIRSRCHFFSVPPPPADRCEAWLRQAGVADAAENWLALAGGSPFLAVDLAREKQVLFDALQAVLPQRGIADPLDAAASIERVIKADKHQITLKQTVEWVQKWLFDLLLTGAGLPPRYFLVRREELRRLAALSSAENVLAFARKSLEYRLFCEQPLNPRLFLEEFFSGYAALFRNTTKNV